MKKQKTWRDCYSVAWFWLHAERTKNGSKTTNGKPFRMSGEKNVGRGWILLYFDFSLVCADFFSCRMGCTTFQKKKPSNGKGVYFMFRRRKNRRFRIQMQYSITDDYFGFLCVCVCLYDSTKGRSILSDCIRLNADVLSMVILSIQFDQDTFSSNKIRSANLFL